MPLLLSEADVRSVLGIPDLIDAMAGALEALAVGTAQQPLRTVLSFGPEQSFFGVMPAYLASTPALGTKLVTVVHGNADRGFPSHLATIILLDPVTGALRAIVDGRYITEARTAAVSAVSTRMLAREDAGVLALIGSGVQARSHLEALGLVRTLREVRVWSPNAARCATFVQMARKHAGYPVIQTASAEQAVAGADLIALVSAAREPVVLNRWVSPGAHICAVGACRPDHREMDTALVARARVFVDSPVAALAESGDLLIPIAEGAIGPEHVAGSLGALIAGRVAGRQAPEDTTVFKSLGLAVEDVTAAHLAWERALARGLGRAI